MSTSRRPVLLLIDVEPDDRKPRPGADGWAASRLALDHLRRLRRELERATGAPVQFNWFVCADPQIEATWGRADWVSEACPEIVRTIVDEGDYCGIHPHFWRWHARRREWFNEFTDRAWMEECFRTNVDAYERIFGRSPEACRVGDRFMNRDVASLMRGAGIRYDLTVEPGLPDQPVADDRHATAWLPDYRSAPRHPYVPSSEDPLIAVEDGRENGRWVVPLSTTPPRWRLVRRPPYLMRASRSPNLALSSSVLRRFLAAELGGRGRLPLVMVLRSGDLGNPHFRRNFLATTGALVRHPGLARCEFTNPAIAVTRWLASRS